jgi:hypothetical protein
MTQFLNVHLPRNKIRKFQNSSSKEKSSHPENKTGFVTIEINLGSQKMKVMKNSYQVHIN